MSDGSLPMRHPAVRFSIGTSPVAGSGSNFPGRGCVRRYNRYPLVLSLCWVVLSGAYCAVVLITAQYSARSRIVSATSKGRPRLRNKLFV